MSHKKSTFDVYCPTCNVVVQVKVVARGIGGFQQDVANPLDAVDTEYHREHYSVAICGRCEGPFLIQESLYGVPGEFETITHEAVLYPVPPGPQLEGLPKAVAGSIDQAHRCVATSSPDACALMCRRALEATCKTLSANGKDLFERLNDLKAKGHIDSRMLDWAHGVRLVGNDAAHEIATSVTIDDARDILEFTDALLEYVFTLDAKYREFQSRRKRQNQSD